MLGDCCLSYHHRLIVKPRVQFVLQSRCDCLKGSAKAGAPLTAFTVLPNQTKGSFSFCSFWLSSQNLSNALNSYQGPRGEESLGDEHLASSGIFLLQSSTQSTARRFFRLGFSTWPPEPSHRVSPLLDSIGRILAYVGYGHRNCFDLAVLVHFIGASMSQWVRILATKLRLLSHFHTTCCCEIHVSYDKYTFGEDELLVWKPSANAVRICALSII